MPRLLVLGRNGQLAQCLAANARPELDIICHGRGETNVLVTAAMRAAFETLRPDIVINTSAFTAVDAAETAREEAQALNAEVPATMADLCLQYDIPLIHYSTDCVFDGTCDRPYSETDTPAPINHYGHTKLAGEIAVAQSGARHLILRVSWLFSRFGSNYVTKMLDLARQHTHLRIVQDEVGYPTYAPDVAKATITLARELLREAPGLSGIRHLCAQAAASRYDFTKQILVESRVRGGPDCPISPVPASDFPTPAARPRNARLSSARLSEEQSIILPHWHEGIRKTLDQLLGPVSTAASQQSEPT